MCMLLLTGLLAAAGGPLLSLLYVVVFCCLGCVNMLLAAGPRAL